MAQLNFPDNPQTNDTYLGDNGITYTFDGVKWTGRSDIKITEIGDTAPNTGILWFNSTEARMYVKYNEQWVDASPLVVPPPERELEVNSVEFADASVQTTAWTSTLSYNDLTDKPATLTVVGGGGASTWLTPV